MKSKTPIKTKLKSNLTKVVANAQHRLSVTDNKVTANPDGANESPEMDDLERNLKHGIAPRRKLPVEELSDDEKDPGDHEFR